MTVKGAGERNDSQRGDRRSNWHTRERSHTRHGRNRERQRIDSQRAQGGNENSDKMGRAASILKSCSTKTGEEMLHNFYFPTILVLHESLGGATASQQRQGYTTENRRGEIRQKIEIRQQTIFFIIYSFFTVSRNGHSATEAATEDRQSKSAGRQRKMR